MVNLILMLTLLPTPYKFSKLDYLVFFNYTKSIKDVSIKDDNQWQELLTIHDLIK